jgi:hypothetical protein
VVVGAIVEPLNNWKSRKRKTSVCASRLKTSVAS